MKILFIGDVVGRPGRRAVAGLLPVLRAEHNLDVIIVNGENSAHGSGLTATTVQALLDAGANIITTGDHVWDQREIYTVIEHEVRLIRPLNLSPSAPGRGMYIRYVDDRPQIAVINLLGRVYMPPNDCPFRAIESHIESLRAITPVIVVDFHAEATSEKIAMGWFLDGRVSAVLGTHTHVQTADERILPKGTAFISDVGMCGAHDSVLGRDREAVVRRFTTGLPQKFEVAEDNTILCGVVIEVDASTGRAISIQRLRAPYP